jgi:nicotinamidase-related amidase
VVARRPRNAPEPVAVGGDKPDLGESRTVLLMVDFINPLEFPAAPRIAPAALAAARATAALKSRLRDAGVQAVYANDNYGVWQSNFQSVFERCEAAGGVPAEMARLLTPLPDDITVLKPRHSAFFATPLQLLLEQLKAERLILAGLATDLCVLFSALDAHVRGYELWVPRDCVASETPRRQRGALHYMETVLGVHTRAAGA